MPAFEFVLGGRYKLLAPLGEGGMATVYRARDLRLNREVAVKILHEDLSRDPSFSDRFDREAEYLASLSHPNIVPVYDVGEEQGSKYIVMEYVRGRTVKDVIEAGGPMSIDRAVQMMISVLDALSYAHGRGLIHRDVKPHNILIGPDDTSRLADFGIAHFVGGSSTRTAAILGSAHYLSPEQARGDEATIESDIYASGVVLYEALTGAPPFEGTNALAIAHQHLHSPPPSLRERRTDVEPGLEGAVMRSLAKPANARFPDAASFRDALEAAAVHLEATTRLPVPAADRTERFLATDLPADPAGVPATVPQATLELVLRRSTRKTGVAALLATLAFAGVSYFAQFRIQGHRPLPTYPSLPYVVVAATILAAVAVSWINVRSWRYRMDGDAAVVQWGLLSHHRFGVPVRYITTLELKQSPIDRLLGVGTVELFARDQHGDERRLVMEDLPHPRRTYEELMRVVGRAMRRRPGSEPPG